MIKLSSRMALLVPLLMAGAAHAQAPDTPSPSVQTTPEVTTPRQDSTPPNGVARGVIRPGRPLDSKMVTKPPTLPHHRMPVITPPGTAR